MEMEHRASSVGRLFRRRSSAVKERRNDETYGALLFALLQNSSAHGLPNIVRASTIPQRLVWFVLFLAAVVVFIIISTSLVNRLLDYDVKVDMSIEFSRNLVFPAITICNLNPLRKSKLEASENDEFRKAFDKNYAPPQSSNWTMQSAPNGEQQHQQTTSANDRARRDVNQNSISENVSEIQTDEYGNFNDFTSTKPPPQDDETYWDWDMDESLEDLYSEQSYDWNMTAEFIQLFSDLPTRDKEQMGHQLKDLLVNCQWNGVKCSPSNFTSFLSSMYGNCFTFNSGRNNSKISSTNYAGPHYGLGLTMFIEQDQYLEEFSDTAGVRIVVHDQNVIPFPEDNGFDVEPGKSVSIGVRREEITREPWPYSNCVLSSDTLEAYANVFTKIFGTNYTLESCMKSCYINRVVEECGCIDGLYPSPSEDVNLSVCRYDNMTDFKCKERIDLEYQTQSPSMKCDCPHPCHSVSYRTEYSSALWPTDNTVDYLNAMLSKRNYRLHEMVEMATATGEDLVRHNMVKLRIYYQDLNYQIVTHSADYRVADLMSDIGGQLGLWIGLSILTLAELIEFVYAVLRLLVRSCLRHKKSSESVHHTDVDNMLHQREFDSHLTSPSFRT
ncbi:epithelial sodium channel subunit alpha-like [Glandiceps talaboti]